MGEKLGGVANAMKKLVAGVKRAVKFFSGAIGQVVLYVIGAIILVILVWLLVTVIAKDIAKLIGVDMSPIKTAEKDAEFLQALSSSGYDALLDANELSEYYTFEYSVLMDAARFLEETGTTEMRKKNLATIDDRLIDRDIWAMLCANSFSTSPMTVPDTTSSGQDVRAQGAAYIKDKRMKGDVVVDEKTGEPLSDYPDEGNPVKAFSTERSRGGADSSGDLYYRREHNQYTNKNYLVPYLRLIRTDDTLRYFYELKNLTSANNYTDDEHWIYGGYFNHDQLPNGNGKIHNEFGGEEGTNVYGDKQRFENNGQRPRQGDGDNGHGARAEDAYHFIFAHVYPFAFDGTLNQSNVMALPSDDKRRKDATPGAVCDLDQDWGPGNIEDPSSGIYYWQFNSSVEYNIPLRVLLDRFLPNANLLASWRHLQDDDALSEVGYKTSETVVREIIKVYNEACLNKEGMDGYKLLVKDVAGVKSVSRSTTAKQLLTGTGYSSVGETALSNYIIGGSEKTKTLYGSYEALAETRDPAKVASGNHQDADEIPTLYDDSIGYPDPGTGGGTPAGGSTTSSTEPYEQEFTEELSGDVRDDLRLVLTHFWYDHSGDKELEGKTKDWFMDAIDDIMKQVDFNTNNCKVVSNEQGELYDNTSDDDFLGQEVVAYRKGTNGEGYLTKCQAVNDENNSEMRIHYQIPSTVEPEIEQKSPPTDIVKDKNGSTKYKHKYSAAGEIYTKDNVYGVYNTTNSDVCFIPFLRVCIQIKDHLKHTAVVICDENGDAKYAYFVTGNEIDDVSQITHYHTFARFEATDLISSTFRNWEFANTKGGNVEESYENWLITDAYEGLGFKFDCCNGAVTIKYTEEESYWVDTTYKQDPAYPDDPTKQIVDVPGHTEYKYTNHEEIVSLEDLELMGLDVYRLAKFLLPGYADRLDDLQGEGSYPLFGDGARDYAIIRTPDRTGYKEGTVDGQGRSEDAYEETPCDDYYPLINPDYKPEKAGEFPQNAFILDEDTIDDYEGLMYKEPPIPWGEAIDPDVRKVKYYLNLRKIGIGTNDQIDGGVVDDIHDPVHDYIVSHAAADVRDETGQPDNPQGLTTYYIFMREFFIKKNQWPGVPRENITKEMIDTAMENYNGKKIKFGNAPSAGPTSTEYNSTNVEDYYDIADPIETLPEISATFPVRIAVSPISQRIITKEMDGYFVKDAKYWAANKEFDNIEVIRGEFHQSDWNNYHFVISNNNDAVGIHDILSSYKNADFRCQFFGPIFGAHIDNTNKTRENDVRLIINEWEEAGNKNIHAADHYIRDIYQLIKYTQGVLAKDQARSFSTSGDDENDSYYIVFASGDYESEDYAAGFDPLTGDDGKSYIHEDSYQYMFIPDEIMQFDPFTCEKAFWMDRIICTRNDAIDEQHENVMRSRLPLFTWQQIDYDEYPETKHLNDDGHSVYALWLFGDQTSRSLYAFSAHASDQEYGMIGKWGGFSYAHQAADLYGRTKTAEIYDSVMVGDEQKDAEKIMFNENYGYGFYPKQGNSAVIKTKVDSSGKVTLYYSEDGSFKFAAPTTTDFSGMPDLASGERFALSGDADDDGSGAGSTGGVTYKESINGGNGGLYYPGTSTTLKLGDTEYTFPGVASAAYAYMVYRQALIEKDPEKAEAVVKQNLERQTVWQEVRAVAPGYVDIVQGNGGSGFYVRIVHDEEGLITSCYCHMKRTPVVQVGEYVGAGTVIGYEGTTGKSLGFHCHMNLKLNKEPASPARFMYPFFTPFWYADKADSDVSSEYYALERTVYPYQQKAGASIPTNNDDGMTASEISFVSGLNYGDLDGLAKTSVDTGTEVSAHKDSQGYVKIKNYVPQYAILYDTKDMITEGVIDYSKLITSNVHRNADKVDYEEDLVPIPAYSDDSEGGFMDRVQENNDKIHGVPFQLTTGTTNPVTP